MKVWYKHPYGRLDQYDMQWVKVYAEVQPQEQEQALAQGFVDLGNHWLQVRSTRINVQQYVKSAPKFKQRKGVSVKTWTGSLAKQNQNLLAQVYDKFIAHNQYKGINIFEDFDITDQETFYCYYFESELVAWSVWSEYGKSIDNWQFAWDYVDQRLRLGKFSLDHEIRTAHQQGYDWFYLGASYDNSCKYKSDVEGFEWWTGAEWSKDVDLYQKHIEADCSVQTLSDLENVYNNAD